MLNPLYAVNCADISKIGGINGDSPLMFPAVFMTMAQLSKNILHLSESPVQKMRCDLS